MIQNIIRDGTKVILEINTGFKREKPILSFSWACTEESEGIW